MTVAPLKLVPGLPLDVALKVKGDDGPRSGRVHVPTGLRLSDVANDPRRFLPLRLPDGDEVLINKSEIAWLAPAGESLRRRLERNSP